MRDFDEMLLKGLLVLLTAPVWFPFLKAVWEELNEAMADEGGLFGRMPTHKELEVLERGKRGKEDALVHEPWLTPEQRMAGRRTLRSPDERRGSGAKAGPRKRGGF